nr:MAG TPA: hypothetical protein [Caudoviricetes sp.]
MLFLSVIYKMSVSMADAFVNTSFYPEIPQLSG